GGKYKIVRFLNSGGFGCTYEAVHTQLASRVAIKEFFMENYCNRDDDTGNISIATKSMAGLVGKLRKKFVDEARSIFKMHHSNIVRVVDIFEENGTSYYAMDFIEGRSLNEKVKTYGPLPEQMALKYIRQVADALKYVHSFNRLHLDVKPGNIMIDANDNAILIDFGASKHYDEESGENTSSLLGINTKGYAPVEQQNASFTTFSPATDIYALGATLYKLLTGITPPDAVSIMGEESMLQPLPTTISQRTRNAVKAAMQLKRKNRPQSIDEFLAILDGKSDIEVEVVSVAGDDGTRIDEPDDAELNVEVVKAGSGSTVKDAGTTGNNVVVGGNPSDRAGNSAGGTENQKEGSESVEEEDKKKSLLQTVIIALACAVVVGIIVYFVIPKQQTQTSQQSTQEPQSSKSGTGKINGHEYVDLGLGVKWATCNVGASSPTGYGYYYAWGETSPKSEYTSDNSKTYGQSMGDIAGKSSYDAARAKWGGSWRLPTASEIDELIKKCKWTWMTQGGVNGYKVTGPNGNSIFLPAAGYRVGSSLNYQGSYGYYWSSTPYESYTFYAYLLDFDSGSFYRNWINRYDGRSVRPVSE
ncbi:MAG: protein kinase, partial [Prevotella sp.]|nr:protein kinase [Prevotella sp.]